MAIELKYRPKTLDDIVGNDEVIAQLKANFVDRVAAKHTVLIHGPRGCGKTTIARILSRETGCQNVREMDIASNGGKEDAATLLQNVRSFGIVGKKKAFILDEVHMGTTAFFNALLKTLEEPPSHVFFFLCTTNPGKVLQTVRSRCAIYEVTPVSSSTIIGLLNSIIKKEKCDVDEKALRRVARSSEGSPREALIMLEKIMYLDKAVQLSTIEALQEKEGSIQELCRALIDQKSWKTVSSILNRVKDINEETVRRAVLGYINAVILRGRSDVHLFGILEEFRDPFYDTGRSGLTLACYRTLSWSK